jgi:hypothetical protein
VAHVAHRRLEAGRHALVAAGPHDRRLRGQSHAERPLRLCQLDTDQVDQLDPRVGRRVRVLARRRRRDRLLRRSLRAARLASLEQQLALGHQRLRQHRRVVDLPRLRRHRARQLQASRVLPRPLERLRRVEPHPHRVDRRLRLHVLRRHHTAQQRLLVGAREQVVQPRDRRHRVLDDRDVGVRQHLRHRPDLAQPPGQARAL